MRDSEKERYMRRIYIVLLAALLAACTAAPPAPTQQAVAPEPLVVTVVVQPTQAPPQQEPIVVTVVVPATAVPEQPTAVPPTQLPAAATSAETTGGAIVLDDLLGKGVFKSITLSGNEFSLRCVTRELTITATAALVDIEEAELFYRTVDQPKALYYSAWKTAGKMNDQGNGVFSMVLTGESVDPNLRLDPGWFEFQLVGLNKGGGVVDRTEKIEQLVTYRINCP
jgi:hypothetical protein